MGPDLERGLFCSQEKEHIHKRSYDIRGAMLSIIRGWDMSQAGHQEEREMNLGRPIMGSGLCYGAESYILI